MARKPKAPAAPEIPAAPPLNARELALNVQITRDLQAAVHSLEQRNLDIAVALAQQAARRQGPLVEHFMELGRRFHAELNRPSKPKLRLVTGGAVTAPQTEEQRIEAAVAKHGSIIAAMRAGAI